MVGKEERLINPILCCSLMLFFRGHAKLYSQPRPWQWEIDGRTRIVEADPGENRGWNCGENNREPNPCEAGRCGVELAFFFFFFWFLFCWTGRESGGITIDTGSAGPGPEAPESAPDGLHKV